MSVDSAVAEIQAAHEQQDEQRLRESHARRRCHQIAQSLFAYIVIHGFTQTSLDQIVVELEAAERRGR